MMKIFRLSQIFSATIHTIPVQAIYLVIWAQSTQKIMGKWGLKNSLKKVYAARKVRYSISSIRSAVTSRKQHPSRRSSAVIFRQHSILKFKAFANGYFLPMHQVRL